MPAGLSRRRRVPRSRPGTGRRPAGLGQERVRPLKQLRRGGGVGEQHLPRTSLIMPSRAAQTAGNWSKKASAYGASSVGVLHLVERHPDRDGLLDAEPAGRGEQPPRRGLVAGVGYRGPAGRRVLRRCWCCRARARRRSRLPGAPHRDQPGSRVQRSSVSTFSPATCWLPSSSPASRSSWSAEVADQPSSCAQASWWSLPGSAERRSWMPAAASCRLPSAAHAGSAEVSLSAAR